MAMNGAVSGRVRVLLRLEGAMLAAAALVLYGRLDAGWGLFAALILVPDIAFLGYLAGPRVGALAYNTTHSLIGPLGLALAALGLPAVAGALPVALIWIAHIGIDRALGYGLKYGAGFGVTHLGRIGKAARDSGES